MTAKTPEDYTDPTDSGQPLHKTQDAPMLPFESFVRLQFKALIDVQTEQGKMLKSMHDLLVQKKLPRLIAKELMNELLIGYSDQFQALNQGREMHARKIKQLEDEMARMREKLDVQENGH